jgi:ATP-dependent Clp protease ATP-binding subunit ClpX
MAKKPNEIGLETLGKKRLWCSFCGLFDDQVEDLVAGPTVLICGDCVSISFEIVQEARARRAKAAKPE